MTAGLILISIRSPLDMWRQDTEQIQNYKEDLCFVWRDAHNWRGGHYQMDRQKRRRAPGGGRKQKYGEPTRLVFARIPESLAKKIEASGEKMSDAIVNGLKTRPYVDER